MRVQIVVMNPRTGARSEEVTALADTGATLTVVPGEIVRQLGVAAVQRGGPATPERIRRRSSRKASLREKARPAKWWSMAPTASEGLPVR